MRDNKKELMRTIKFALFSLSAGVIQIIADVICNEVIHLDSWWSYLIALTLSVLWNFTLNRKFTFQSASNIPKAMALVALFYLVFAPLSTWWTKVLVGEHGWNEYLVLILTMTINLVTEYLYQRFVVFRNSLDTAKK